MILILGGTTEGRNAVRIADEAGKPYYYSTRGEEQDVPAHHGIRLTGAMDAAAMNAFCREKEIRLIVDAAHPFAVQLHHTIAGVAEQLDIPVIRYERIYPPRDEDIIWCEDYEDAIKELKAKGVRRLLALTSEERTTKEEESLQPDTYFISCGMRKHHFDTFVTLYSLIIHKRFTFHLTPSKGKRGALF